MIIESAPYLHDFSLLAPYAARLRYPALLVSCGDEAGEFNRYSIFAAEPIATLESSDPQGPLRFSVSGTSARAQSIDDFYRAVSNCLGLIEPIQSGCILPWSRASLPFLGGLIGAMSYESGARFERMPALASPESGGAPHVWFGLYPCAYVADHSSGEAWWIMRDIASRGSNHTERISDKLKEAVFEALHSAGAQTNTDEHRDGASSEAPIEDWRSDWTPSLDPSQYKGAVERILEYIRAGDVYQANLTIRYRREFHAAPHLLFSQLLRTNPAPFSTFIQADDWAVAGSSPELLLDLRRDGSLQTRPIKGTISRSENDGAKRLLASAKDRAEHLMIVDLERNDLGKVCEFGSVYVDPMMRIESYAGLHHMVSSVRGRIRAGLSPADALAALFPGGSVTGAPKIRAMEIIHELEPVPRGIYTGAIGWITPEGESRMSLAIRTMTCHDGIVDLHVGGGIVADSDPEKEAEECALKGRAMARAAEGTLFIG